MNASACRFAMRFLFVAACVNGFAAQAAALEQQLRVAPNALLTIDQNRSSVVERIVSEWGDALAQSHSVIDSEQLRSMLFGMRADHLLAASLAGNIDGLRNVLANALTSTADVKPNLLHGKSLGDSSDDLVYTPVAPCRIVDTRIVGGAFAAGGQTRSYHAFLTSGTFAAQGGAGSNCGIPANPAAAALNITTVGGGGFLTAWPYGSPQPSASTMNPAPGTILANGALVPLCQPNCADEFSIFTFGANVVVDIVGYFRTPVGNALFGASVGIGTNTPQSKLHVLTTTASGVPPRAESSGTSGFAAGWDFYYNGTGKGYVGVPDAGASIAPGEMILYGGTGTKTSIWAGQTRAITIDSTTRNVGIGTANPSIGKLHVVAATGTGVAGTSPDWVGVFGASTGFEGVHGESSSAGAAGVAGYSISGTGIGTYGSSSGGAAVYGTSTSGTGAVGNSTTGTGVYGTSGATGSVTNAGVWGIGTDSGGIGIHGQANVGNAWGVFGESASPTGTGVYARNTGGGRALYAEGNAGQLRTSGGLAKAMAYVDQNGNIIRCYNGITNSSAVPCGFSINHFDNGHYTFNFGFAVCDRFMSILARSPANPYTLVAASYRTTADCNQVEVYTGITDAVQTGDDADFHIIVF